MTDGPFYVTFKVVGQPRKAATPDHENWTMDMLKDGFWITKEYLPCLERQGHYWIPPSQVLLIEKRDQPQSTL